MTAKLLVVDDEPRTAELTAEILRRAGYSVDVAGSGTEALERVRLGSPDLMLLDYEMPDMEAPEVLDSLRSGTERIPFPVIILTGARHSPGDQVVGIERGAADYIVKGTDRQVMLARVRGALRERASPAPKLTPRQDQVLQLLGEGASTDQIAAMLHLSKETVRNHIRHILRALGAHSRLEAVALAHRGGLLRDA